MTSLCRKFESDQCRQVLPIVRSWHVNLVLFWFNSGQAPQRCLVSKFMSSIKCFGLLPQVYAQQEASLFCLSHSSRNCSLKRSIRFMSSTKCFDLSPQVHPVQALSGCNFFPERRRRHTCSCLFLNENDELSRSHSRQIDLCRQGLHSCELLPCWLRSKVAGVTY